MLRRNRVPCFLRPLPRQLSKKLSHTTNRTKCSTTSPANFPLFYSDHYTYPLPLNHRFPMHKYEDVRKRLQSDPLFRNSSFRPSPLATRLELEAAHCRNYIERFLSGKLSRLEERQIGFPWSLYGVRRALGSTGGTVAAMREVLNGARMAGQIAGGTHHARRESGGGFCVFNDIAVACYEALRFGVEKVVILDFDVHQGEGSASIFRDEGRVMTVSFHANGNYPFEKEVSDVDIGFEDGVGDEEYLEDVMKVVPRVLDNAEVVVLQMGVDTLVDDSLGRLSLSREGLSRRNRMVYEEVLKRGLKSVITMGGGYSKPIEKSIQAHCDVYKDAVKCLSEM